MLSGLDNMYSTYIDPAQHLITTAIGFTAVVDLDHLDDLDRDLSVGGVQLFKGDRGLTRFD